LNSRADEEVLRSRFGRHASAGLVSAIVVRGLGIVLVKILSIYLTKIEYGTYALWLALVFLLSTISTSPFSATIWRYLQKKRLEIPKDASKLLTFCFIGSLVILGVIYAGLFFAFILFNVKVVADPIYLSALSISGILTIFYVLKEVILVVSGSEQNSREILSFNLAFGIASTTIGALLAVIFQELLLVLVGLCLGYSVPILAALVIKLKQYQSNRFGREEVKLVTEFGGPIMVANSATNAVPFITSFLVSLWIGLAEVGTLSIAQTLAGLLSFVISPVLMAYNAYMVMTYETSDFDKGNQVTTRVVELYLTLVTPIVWLTISYSTFLIELISTGAYLDSAILIPYTVLAVAILSLSQFWKIRIELAQKTYIAAIVYTFATAGLVISSVIFLQEYGLVGIGFAILIHSILVMIGLYISANKYIPISLRPLYFASWTVSVALLIVTDMLIQQIGLSSLISGIIASGVYLVMLILTRGLKPREILNMGKMVLQRT
jgi:O-antigen/teichoic acid export membrane protein